MTGFIPGSIEQPMRLLHIIIHIYPQQGFFFIIFHIYLLNLIKTNIVLFFCLA